MAAHTPSAARRPEKHGRRSRKGSHGKEEELPKPQRSHASGPRLEIQLRPRRRRPIHATATAAAEEGDADAPAVGGDKGDHAAGHPERERRAHHRGC